MFYRKTAISFILILAIVMSLGTTLVFGQNKAIEMRDIKSGAENGVLYEDESAQLIGTVKPQNGVSSFELGLYTSEGGLEQTTTVDTRESEYVPWHFEVILPKAGDYEAGYYTVRIMNSEDENGCTESPGFTISKRDEIKEKVVAKPETEAAKVSPKATSDGALLLYTAKSADNAINMEFSTTGAIATPCSVEYKPLTDREVKAIKKGSANYFDYYGIGDVSVLDKMGHEVAVTGASAVFDMNKLLKGAAPLDYEYDDSYIDEIDDYYSDETELEYDEDYDEDSYYADGYYDDYQKYSIASVDRFYDFNGDLFVYNYEEDRFYNQEDPTEYYYYVSEEDSNEDDETDYSENDEEDNDEEDEADYSEDDEDYSEDEESYSAEDSNIPEEYDLYYSNDGLYYYYFESDWDYDPDMEDGYFFDSYYDIYYLGGRCYYYDKEKDAYFIDTKFEEEHPEYINDIKIWLSENGSDSVEYDYHWFAYVAECDTYALNGNYYYKDDDDAFYFDKDFNEYALYSNGNYYYFNYEYDEQIISKESSAREVVKPKDIGYNYLYGGYAYPEYKTNEDTISYDGYGTGNKFGLDKDTEIRFVEANKNKGIDWVRIVSPQFIKYSKEQKNKRKRFFYEYDDGIFNEYEKSKKGYTIDRVGYAKLSSITPVLDDGYDKSLIHLNEDGSVGTLEGTVTKDNKLEVKGVASSSLVVASHHTTELIEYAPSSDNAKNTGNTNAGRGVLGKRNSYDTSDSSNLAVWIALGVLALLGFCISTRYYRKKALNQN